ncbi:MAG: hypothetical protein HON94_12835 [Methylococcales bacterium]|nr:hypothetical protein [Methylococcales bacterium]
MMINEFTITEKMLIERITSLYEELGKLQEEKHNCDMRLIDANFIISILIVIIMATGVFFSLLTDYLT